MYSFRCANDRFRGATKPFDQADLFEIPEQLREAAPAAPAAGWAQLGETNESGGRGAPKLAVLSEDGHPKKKDRAKTWQYIYIYINSIPFNTKYIKDHKRSPLTMVRSQALLFQMGQVGCISPAHKLGVW